MSGSGNVNLTIVFVSGGESLASFTKRFFYLADHQALDWRLMRPKETEDLATFSVREIKRAAEERERDVYSSAKEQ